MSRVAAVLGPTNTGKTHLAIERMCAHSSGMIGFPLRLLAREVYDRLVAIKGPKEVALVTGEERIVPPGARWFACTAESMPLTRDLAFVAVDEAQLGSDRERGHVFTDRLLHARGREETLILGSGALSGLVRTLLPRVEIIRRPRFSTLSYAGAKKLSRLPKRSVIVAFSAEEVYAVAEMLRRARGGAGVVMGALSPRTRNAQVAMFQSGEVDYLVATDAIGMGLNLDIDHVAFASLSKFDGQRQRRLTIAEMAQIAGRAGRHQRDGSFGSLGSDDGANVFTPEEVEAVEAHRVPALDWLYWRNGDPDQSSVAALIAALEARPTQAGLRAAPEAIDLTVLKRLADDPQVAARARSPAMVARLWETCGLPDFRKVGPEHHARLVARMFGHRSEGAGVLPADWVATELARLDVTTGDIAQLGQRIAAARTWTYVAERPGWLADQGGFAARAQAVEEKLSDALHARLVERFVDRRTSVLMKSVGRDLALLDVQVDDDGTVLVEGEAIGSLDGFAFRPDPAARALDAKRLIAAAQRHLTHERARRAAALIGDDDAAFSLDGIAIVWRDTPIARLAPGPALTEPRVVGDPPLATLTAPTRAQVVARVSAWVTGQVARHLAPLQAMATTARDGATPASVRALLAALAANGGTLARGDVDDLLAVLDAGDRRILRAAGLTIGTLDIFDARLLKPGARRWLGALAAARTRLPVPVLPPPGATIVGDVVALPGFRRIGDVQVRLDLVERVARALHDRRQAREPFTPNPALATSFGVDAATFAAILRACGFREAGDGAWAWRHRPRLRVAPPAPPSAHFAGLVEVMRGGTR